MTGLLTLSECILCKKEVLGKVFECEMAGTNTQIHFPQYPVIDNKNPHIGISNPLLPPGIGSAWKRGKETLLWGLVVSYPSGNSDVNTLALSIKCEEAMVTASAKKLYEAISNWEHAFIDYLKLETKQHTDRNQSNSRNTCTLELMEGKKHIPDNRIGNIYGRIPNPESFASESTIKKAIAFADSGKELLLEYQMLLSSYSARRNNQNRLAILDACSAVELSLVNQIKLYCQSIGLLPEILLNKYRYLGDKFDLIRKIYTAFPNLDYKTIIIDPRNAVMHNKEIYPSDDTTEKLIACVETVLDCFHTEYY